MLFAWITDPNAWLALGTLTLLEIVLGIDNIISSLWWLQNSRLRNVRMPVVSVWRRR